MQIADRADAVNGDDVRVLEVCNRDGFLAESVHHAFAEQQAGRHDFDGDAPVQCELARAEYCRHAPVTQLALELELGRECRAQSFDDRSPGWIAFVSWRGSSRLC